MYDQITRCLNNSGIGKINQRKFRFCHPHGYKGDRLIVSFYETYIVDNENEL
jgi:hypothetical protein